MANIQLCVEQLMRLRLTRWLATVFAIGKPKTIAT